MNTYMRWYKNIPLSNLFDYIMCGGTAGFSVVGLTLILAEIALDGNLPPLWMLSFTIMCAMVFVYSRRYIMLSNAIREDSNEVV